jgi:hypothetical protein
MLGSFGVGAPLPTKISPGRQKPSGEAAPTGGCRLDANDCGVNHGELHLLVARIIVFPGLNT